MEPTNLALLASSMDEKTELIVSLSNKRDTPTPKAFPDHL